MDRRGRGSSGDGDSYSLENEYDDVAAVADHLADGSGRIDVFAHSYGAICTLGAAAGGAPFRHIALYEPPGPETVSAEWVNQMTALIANGNPGRAMFSFLTDIIGLSTEQFEQLKSTPGASDVLAIVTVTMAREASALLHVDLASFARSVCTPVLLLLGDASPP